MIAIPCNESLRVEYGLLDRHNDSLLGENAYLRRNLTAAQDEVKTLTAQVEEQAAILEAWNNSATVRTLSLCAGTIRDMTDALQLTKSEFQEAHDELASIRAELGEVKGDLADALLHLEGYRSKSLASERNNSILVDRVLRLQSTIADLEEENESLLHDNSSLTRELTKLKEGAAQEDASTIGGILSDSEREFFDEFFAQTAKAQQAEEAPTPTDRPQADLNDIMADIAILQAEADRILAQMEDAIDDEAPLPHPSVKLVENEEGTFDLHYYTPPNFTLEESLNELPGLIEEGICLLEEHYGAPYHSGARTMLAIADYAAVSKGLIAFYTSGSDVAEVELTDETIDGFQNFVRVVR